ncbi:MAG: hypothetical protein IPN69_08435 [Acidobacteria bacterium]|nr:hypothetical protein [Acidobacteriota bacterium]
MAVALPLIIGGASMALQFLLQPRIKQTPTDKGKLDDIRITGSEYGSFIPRVWGRARVGGNIIFSDGVVHTIQNTPSGGGKGVPQAPATRTHTYTSSIGVLICRGQVSNFLRTWADADLILGNGDILGGSFEAEAATLSGGASSAVDVNASGGNYATGLGSGGQAAFDFSSIGDPPYPNISDPNEIALAYTRIEFFYKCNSDLQATIDTDTTADFTLDFLDTNGSWTAITHQVPGFVDSLVFKNAIAAAPDLDLIVIEKYWFIDILENPNTFKTPTFNVTGNVNANIVYPLDVNDPSAYYNAAISDDGTGKVALTIPVGATRYYKGTQTQDQDAAEITWLNAKYGAGEGILRASGHRGLAWVMFENRVLKQARVENFTFEVDLANANVNAVLTDLFTDVGLVSGDLTLTATNGLTFVGCIEHTAGSRRQLIEALERYFFFRIAERDGKIVTVLDTLTSSATIDADLLRAHDDGNEMPNFDAEIMVKEESQLPREIRVSVMNPDLEYKNESVASALFGSLDATESVEYTFPLVERPDEARNVAERLILKAHSEYKSIEFFGMPEMAIYSVGDVITVPINGTNVKMRIEKKQMTLPLGKIRFQGVTLSEFTPTYYQDDVTSVAPIRRQQLVTTQFPRNSVPVAIISPPLTARDRGKLGVYLAVCGRGRGAAENIAVYREYDTDNYILQYVADSPALMGICEDTLGNHLSEDEDTTNVLDIWFFDAITLESVLLADLVRYPTLNLIRVGDEWLQFRTATAQTLEENSPYRSKWRISNLTRGTFGTTAEIGSHAADEYATVFTEAVRWFPLDNSDVGETVTIKAVTNGQAEENGQTTTFTFNPISAYTVTNDTADRTFDANATTIDELADVVATIIDDLNL